jgi:Fic family protein
MWKSMRGAVIKAFPKAPGLPKDKDAYLHFIDEIYQSDAYHSLSIEGYSVTPALIERVREGGWDPDHHEDDRKSRDALAARGYWQAFQKVKATVVEVIAGGNPGSLVRAAHVGWYRELFQPCVAAGLIEAGALAGYRNSPVYLRTSRYVPPRWEAARAAMPALFDLLEKETEPSVRAVLGHWMFGYIHPYPDGNGRMARFLMNAMLASGGLSVDSDPREGSQDLFERAGQREHRHGHQSVLHLRRKAGAMVSRAPRSEFPGAR